MKRLVLFMIFSMLLITAAHAGPVDRVTNFPNWKEETPKENVFRIEGNPKEFILLEADDKGFFILTKDAYGRKVYDPDKTQRFDPSDQNNIAHWLNNEFLTVGNGDGHILPSELIPFINEHSWETEAGRGNGNAPEDYTAISKVALMAQSEFVSHYQKFGFRDAIPASGNGWWLRTAHGVGATPDLMLTCKVTDELIGRTDQWPAHTALYVRPVFYLDGTFFRSVKLDTYTLGSNVKKAILELYKLHGGEFPAFYSKDEIESIQDTSLPVSEDFTLRFPDRLGRILDPDEANAYIDLLISGTEQKEYTISYSISDTDRKEVTASVKVSPHDTKTHVVPMSDLRNGIYTIDVTIKQGKRLCKEMTGSFSIMPRYSRQFMDDLTRRGVVTHYANRNQTNEDDAVMLNRAGVRYIRDDFYWGSIESERGVYNFARTDSYIKPRTAEGIYVIGAMGYGNRIYSGLPDTAAFSDKTGLNTREQIEAYSNYVYEFVKNYPEVREIEIWNEPNGGIFWKPTNVADYTNLLKSAAVAARKADPTVKILGGATSGTDTTFINNMFTRGAYPYVDAISFHPYIYPADVDQGYHGYIERMKNVVLRYGGWKDLSITEVGWSSQTGSKGVSEERQAGENMKQLIIGDNQGIKGNGIYTFREKGDDPANNENMFGIIRRDFSGKPAYLALTQLNIMLGGAIYFGEVDLGERISAHLYQKNNMPLMVLWSKTGESTYKLDQGARALDMLGNPIDGTDITLAHTPVYIDNLSREWFNKSAEYTLGKKYTNFLTTYDEKLPQDIKEGLSQLMLSVGNVSEQLSKHYEQGSKLIKNLDLDPLEISQMLYKLHDIGIVWGNLLGVSWPENSVYSVSSRNELNEVERIVKERAELGKGSLIYSEAMLKNITELTRNAETVLHSSRPLDKNRLFSWDLKEKSATKTKPLNYAAKSGVIKNWDTLALELTSWLKEFALRETVQNIDLLMQISSSDTTVYAGIEQTVNVSIANSARSPFVGAVKMFGQEGELIAETEEIRVGAESAENGVLNFIVNEVSKTGKLDYTLRLYDSDVEVSTYQVQFSVLDRVDMELLPVSGVLEDVKEIKLRVKNTFSEKLTGRLTLEPPPGFVLSTNTLPIELESSEEQIYSFGVIKAEKFPFNFYSFTVTLGENNGSVIMKRGMPLSFLTIVKNTTPISIDNFDGDITDWADAYPIYLTPPKQADVLGDWHLSDVSAMAYMKWDDKYFYLLANVYDNAFAQNRTGGSLWEGDCLQISFDTLDTKSGSYDADDYEISVGRTPTECQVYYNQGVDNSAGEKPTDWAKIIRDNTKRITRYLVRIPKEHLTPLTLRAGTSFGFNLVANDADSDSRERWSQFTKGTADTKNTRLYYSWTMHPAQEAADISGIEKYNLPIDIEISDDPLLDFNTMHNQ